MTTCRLTSRSKNPRNADRCRFRLDGRAAQGHQVLPDHPRRDGRQFHAPAPPHQTRKRFHRPQVGFLGVRVVVLGVKELLPGKATRRPGTLNHRGQLKTRIFGYRRCIILRNN